MQKGQKSGENKGRRDPKENKEVNGSVGFILKMKTP